MANEPNFHERFQEVSLDENGGKILFATDDFFAVAENLLKRAEPIWNDNFTEFGKWMDGWETRRKRIAGHDWTIIELGQPSQLRGICVDTAFFTGNYAPRFSLQGACLCQDTNIIQNREHKMGTAANNEELKRVAELQSDTWETLIPMTDLKSGNPNSRKQYFELTTGDRVFTHLRLNIYPDGGVARLRVYGQPVSLDSNIGRMEPLRGECISCSNAHYGKPDNLLRPWPSEGMHDGWETARRIDRPPKIDVDDTGLMQINGEEWAILKLEKPTVIEHIEVDTTHFKGNCPDNVKIEGAFIGPDQCLKSASWITIFNRTKLIPHQKNSLKHPFVEKIKKVVNHVKVTIAPDGGLARIRIFGTDCDT